MVIHSYFIFIVFTMALDKKYLQKLCSSYLQAAEMRRVIIKEAGDALHAAKRAIFAFQRGDSAEAKMLISSAEKLLQGLSRRFHGVGNLDEGAFHSAIEEYVEAVLFQQFVETGKIGKITALEITPENYLAGLCDVPGELHRLAVRAATERNNKLVLASKQMAEEIIEELLRFNMTSYLRTKFDQAKQALQKLEQIAYEISLRQNS